LANSDNDGRPPRNHPRWLIEGTKVTPDEFRRFGRATIDWIADYIEQVEQFPVRSCVKPGEIRAKLPDVPPEQGEPFEAILHDFNKIILPGITHWQSPNFFAYFPSNNSGPSILGELLSAGLGVQGMLWSTSPACTELETHVLDWFVDLLGLPRAFLSTSTGGGVIQDSASSATLCAIIAARERATSGQGNRAGLDGSLVAYTSTQAHSSVEKGVRIAGLGSDNLHLIDVDERYAMRPDRLDEAVAADLAAGRRPCFVCATIGTTSSTAIDPIAEIGRVCRRHGLWLHVDAALAGTAALCSEMRHLHDGLEFADSYGFNPHKWMFTNFDCNCFFVADRAALICSLSILPEYLRNQATESGAVIDYRDWQVPLGRRFRALKLWFVLRSFGVEGLRERIRRHLALARELTSWIEADTRFELAAPTTVNLVCFRLRAGDAANQKLLDALNASGHLYLTHTRLGDRLTLRMCIGQTNTERRHVEQAWRLIQETAD
jgi:aromatic-L-amino-acid/L-tryptophan decarboxylase